VNNQVWTDLTDPSDIELVPLLPERTHRIATTELKRVRAFEEEAFPSLESHGSESTDDYLFGELAYPVFSPDADDIGTISLRIVIDFERLITVTRTPRNLPEDVKMPDLSGLLVRAQAKALESGSCFCFLMEEVTHEINRLVEIIEDRSEIVEQLLNYDEKPPTDCRKQLARLRNHFLQLKVVIQPTLTLVDGIIADEIDLREVVAETQQERELFPRNTEIFLIAVRNSLRHALLHAEYWLENLDTLQDNLSDYLNREQTKAGNRLAAMASIMLLPTFIVGLYGMNIDSTYFPEFGWLNGYLFSWSAIALITVIQVAIFRKKGWIFGK
jgi:Mg2+ and Co2+ transporter CorA|tara:strand:+ start:368 stop:1351 length:984 start_codon:yes stop_codon:yes gene_type:complete